MLRTELKMILTFDQLNCVINVNLIINHYVNQNHQYWVFPFFIVIQFRFNQKLL